MFLTKKGFRKAWIVAICYFVLGSICFIIAAHFKNLGSDSELLQSLSILIYLLCVPVFFAVRYSEGEGKLILLGGKLVQKELKPAAFIEEYESLRNADNLIVNKPSVDVLTIVASAYDLQDDRVNVLKTLDEMIAVAGEKKTAYAMLLKASALYTHNRTEEAETLFIEAQKMKLGVTGTAVLDVVLKTDRAMALGDYDVAEAYYLKLLERKVPKLNNLMKLATHQQLGEIYEKRHDYEKTVAHYQYCVNNGGETAIKQSAVEKLQYLKSEN